MTKRSIRDLDVQNKRVLLRVDYNVPMSKDGAITDDKRILETLPTIRYLLDKNATIIVVTHMGRPDGRIVESLRLDKIAQRLSALLGKPVSKLNSVVGPDVTEVVANAKPGDIIMLENVRFLKEEKNGSEELAKQLAALADVYVDDAFATAHRPDTSVAGRTPVPSIRSRLPAREGDQRPRDCHDVCQEAIHSHSGRRQGLRQDRPHQEPAHQD